MTKKTIQNLYVVSSPFQCISAIEAKTQLGLNNNNILVSINYLKDGKENHLQMREILKLTNWDEIIEIGIEKKRSKLFDYISVIKRLKKFTFNYVFIGHFSQFQTILLSNLKIDKIYSIDDGVATLQLHKGQLNPLLKEKISFSKKIKMLRYSLVMLKTSFDKQRINYFTMFDINAYYGENIIINKFEFMKSYFINKTIDENSIYFLGQPMYDDGCLSKENYILYLEKIKNYFMNKNKSMMYIPHRREVDIECLKSLEDKNFMIKKTHTAIEVYFLSLDILPKEIYSFVSTALISMQKIFNIKTKAFYIEQEILLKNKQAIQELYAEFKNNDIEVIKI